MSIDVVIKNISQYIWSWPLIIAYTLIGLYASIRLNFLQIRYLIDSFKFIIFPDKSVSKDATMTPFQAFINALGTGTGNGSIAGMATAVAMGGPGAAFWVLISGIFALILRFAEVYLATSVIGKYTFKGAKGGPMVYLSLIPGGRYLPYIFTALMLLYGLTSGNAMQANSMGLGMYTTWKIHPFITAGLLVAFLAYIIFGGASRVLKISDMLVPFKVGIFLVSSFTVLIYHYAGLIGAFKLIFANAMSTCSISGAAVGITVQAAIQNGLARSLNANEGGLGVAALLFGTSGTDKPVRTSIMSMVSVFISTYLVSFVVALAVIVSGVWNNGQNSTALTVSAFNTVFGQYGGWVVTFCSASFGLGVLVSFYLIAKECWMFLTNNKFGSVFNVLYCTVALYGTLTTPKMIWAVNDIVNATMLLINLYAIVYLMPKIRRAVVEYQMKNLPKN